MDELELLKKDWNTRTDPQVSQDDIYKMLHKKSSSKVKWIFYISVIELLIGVVSTIWSLSHSNENFILNDGKHDYSWLPVIFESVACLIIVYYAIKFYKNYKKISVDDDAKTLMKNIIVARRTVKNYITVSLISGGVFVMTGLFLASSVSPIFLELYENNNHLVAYLVLIAIILVITTFIIGVIWLLYQLIYGLLLRNLNKNYKEIKKLEV
ncbi:paraquat-inducible protein A [Spongiivirga citrea]|uniref:Beta-carotene 15,15'-monooxygenase n=1 Tax=Spongiivirga citrea TaxID=1481457 RepID=A0A6M0CQD9_9FLAO|nr:paraquat-inducible protein A [Spongiivirga citrea]NER17717.1 hypothetical protein [Spongiivirga citrea]